VLRHFYSASGLFILLVTGAAGGSLWASSEVGITPQFFYAVWPGPAKIAQALNLLTILLGCWLFVRGLRGMRTIRTGAILAFAAPVLLLVSAAWSFDPQATIRRGVEYLFVVLGGIGIASSVEGDEFMDVIVLSCAVSLVSSLALRRVHPDLAMQDFTAMRGIFSHKNIFGEVMALGVLSCLHCLRVPTRGRSGRMLYGGALIAFLGFALASKSATGFVTAFAYLGADSLISLYRKGGIARIAWLLLVVVALPIVLTILLFPGDFFDMIGKDPTLSGRTEVWDYVLAAINQRPWLGWGYWGFWSPDNPVAAEISVIVQWPVPEAHNAVLELLLDVGALGTAFFIFLWLRNIWLALRCMRTRAAPIAITALYCYAGIGLMGVSEALMMDPFQPTTLVFFTTGLMCEKAIRTARRTRRLVVHRPYPAGYVREPVRSDIPVA